MKINLALIVFLFVVAPPALSVSKTPVEKEKKKETI